MFSEFNQHKQMIDSLTPSELYFVYNAGDSTAPDLLKFSLQQLYLQSCIGLKAIFHKNEEELNNSAFSNYLKSYPANPKLFIDFRNLEWDHVRFGTQEVQTPYFSEAEIATAASDYR